MWKLITTLVCEAKGDTTLDPGYTACVLLMRLEYPGRLGAPI